MQKGKNHNNNTFEINKSISGFLIMKEFIETSPLKLIMGYCDAILSKDFKEAVDIYIKLCSDLILQRCRRVTGNIWKDFVFSQLFEQEHKFAQLAKQRIWDPLLNNAFKSDLKALEMLFNIDSSDLLEMINNEQEIHKSIQKETFEKPIAETVDDGISKIAMIAWAGNSDANEVAKSLKNTKQLKKNTKQNNLIDNKIDNRAINNAKLDIDIKKLPNWSYDEAGKHVVYESDNHLSDLYRYFLTNKKWEDNIQKLYDFFSINGTSEFLKHRFFIALDDTLEGIDSFDAPEWDEIICTKNQKERLYANTLKYFHTSKADNVLLYGNAGMGKSTMVYSIFKEITDIRMIIVACKRFEDVIKLIKKIQSQPFKFVLFFSDMYFETNELARLKILLDAKYNKNIIVYATSNHNFNNNSLFGQRIEFEPLSQEEFLQCVKNIVKKKHVYVNDAIILEQYEEFDFNEKDNLNIVEAYQLSELLVRQSRVR